MIDRDITYQITDEIWEQIRPMLPPEITESGDNRPRIDNRKAMEAILWVFRAGCKWKELPVGLGSPDSVCWRLREWQRAGLFQRMWQSGLLTYDEMKALVWYGKERKMPPKR
jgi:putative transposase